MSDPRAAKIREPAVAGTFYPSDETELASMVEDMLNEAKGRVQILRPPKALIVPHAGYVYSGSIAASAYVQLHSQRDTIRKVVLLGPAHRVAVRGMALPESKVFRTPLGDVPIVADTKKILSNVEQVTVSEDAHRHEHSLEVQLPFLQKIFESFELVPLVVGLLEDEAGAKIIDELWGGPETLILVSSDLSHFLPYESAKKVDRETAEAILNAKGTIPHDQACGGTPVSALLVAAKRRNMQVELLDLRNSGDTEGDRARVVGYGAFAFFEDSSHG